MTSKEYFDYFSEEMQNRGGCITNPVMLVVLLLVVMCLFGCKTQYVPVETVVKEYIHSTDTVREKDTIRNEKETIIREMNAADSAMLAKLGLEVKANQHIILVLQKELERQSHEREESKTDTIYRDKEVQVPMPVERKLSRWEQIKMDYGAVSIGISIAAVIAAIVALIVWIRKRKLL